jgi:hypothetical protein
MWTPRTMISAVSVAAILLAPVPAAAEPVAGLVGPAVTVPGDGAAGRHRAIATPPPQASAADAAQTLVLRVFKGQVELDVGAVLVPLRARCEPGVSVYELDVNVRQRTAFGSASMLRAGLIPCDGRWHRITVSIAPSQGSFVSGEATVEAVLHGFHPAEGDFSANDTVTVNL